MANKIQIIIDGKEYVTKELKKVNKETEQLGKGSEEASKKTKMLTSAQKALAGALTVGTIVAVGKAVVELGKLGAKAEQSERALQNLAGGAQAADRYIRAIQDASRGTISEMDAMQMATTAMTLDVVENAQQMERLTEIAVTLGKAQGLTATQAVSDLTTALGRQSPMILDNLGITMRMNEAYEGYADTLGKSVSQLTDVEKKQAFVNEALAKGAAVAAKLGGVIEDNQSKVEQGTAAWKDLRVEIGKNFSSAVGEAAGETAGFAKRMQTYLQYSREANLNTMNWGNSLDYAQFMLTGTSKKLEEFNTTNSLSAGQMGDYAEMNRHLRDEIEKTSGALGESIPATEEATAANREAAAAAAEHAQSMGDLAMNLMEATEAQIGKELIGMLDPEEMGAEAYSTAVQDVGLAFGLMDEKSLALAENLPKLAAALEEGTVPAEDAAEAMEWLVGEAEGGNVAFGDLIDKFGTLPSYTGPLEEELGNTTTAMAPLPGLANETAGGIDNIGGAAERTTGKLGGLISKMNEMLSSFSVPSVPSTPTGRVGGRQSGGPVQRHRPYLVGEQGPEMFVPDTSGSIVPGNMTSGGGGGSTNVSVHIGSLMVSDNAMVDQLANKIAQRVQQKGGYRDAYRRI